MPEMRLQRFLAQAGVASRRKAEELIVAGRVKVNGQIVTELGSKVDPDADKVFLGGKRLLVERAVYLMLNKPRGYVTTMSDPEGRPTVSSFLKRAGARIFPVGASTSTPRACSSAPTTATSRTRSCTPSTRYGRRTT